MPIRVGKTLWTCNVFGKWNEVEVLRIVGDKVQVKYPSGKKATAPLNSFRQRKPKPSRLEQENKLLRESLQKAIEIAKSYKRNEAMFVREADRYTKRAAAHIKKLERAILEPNNFCVSVRDILLTVKECGDRETLVKLRAQATRQIAIIDQYDEAFARQEQGEYLNGN